MKTIYRFFFILSALLWIITPGYPALYLPESHAVNGGITIIPVVNKQKPEAFYNKKRVTVVSAPQRDLWLLVVGIPLEAAKSIQMLALDKPALSSIPFHISEKFYPVQSLTIKDTRKVNPNLEDYHRINEENAELKLIFKRFSDNNPYAQPFKAPVHAPISSLFGLKRFYNKQARPPHLGLDIAAM